MKTRHALLNILISAGLTASAYAQESKGPLPDQRIVRELLSITAKVLSIDIATRELTLKGPMGNLVTVVAGDKVKSLNEIRHGDEVTVKYYIGIAAELRPPTLEEQKQPFVILNAKETSTNGTTPAGAAAHGARVVRVVTTVEALDRLTQTATLKGPRGHYLTVRVKDPSLLEKSRLGDTVLVTCAEALAISVEKVKARE